MSRYASSAGGPLKASREFKEMVKALHGSGIEVWRAFCQSPFRSFLLLYLSMFLSRFNFVIQTSFLPLPQVILDVVYNHTNEADDANPYTTSFRGIDNKVKLNNSTIFLCQLTNNLIIPMPEHL